jgi:hypothetical protein
MIARALDTHNYLSGLAALSGAAGHGWVLDWYWSNTPSPQPAAPGHHPSRIASMFRGRVLVAGRPRLQPVQEHYMEKRK